MRSLGADDAEQAAPWALRRYEWRRGADDAHSTAVDAGLLRTRPRRIAFSAARLEPVSGEIAAFVVPSRVGARLPGCEIVFSPPPRLGTNGFSTRHDPWWARRDAAAQHVSARVPFRELAAGGGGHAASESRVPAKNEEIGNKFISLIPRVVAPPRQKWPPVKFEAGSGFAAY
jgi:hypothetical protein